MGGWEKIKEKKKKKKKRTRERVNWSEKKTGFYKIRNIITVITVGSFFFLFFFYAV